MDGVKWCLRLMVRLLMGLVRMQVDLYPAAFVDSKAEILDCLGIN